MGGRRAGGSRGTGFNGACALGLDQEDGGGRGVEDRGFTTSGEVAGGGHGGLWHGQLEGEGSEAVSHVDASGADGVKFAGFGSIEGEVGVGGVGVWLFVVKELGW
jgi:hypothetical protein